MKKQKVKKNILSIPYHVRKERINLNQERGTMIGEPYFVTSVFQPQDRNIRFHEGNNIFYSITSLQKAIVKYYNFTISETNGTLVFVIKLDECEVLKQKKMERVTTNTIMN